jgi:hypothetical protein
LSLARPVIDAVGEARSNADVFGELAARLDVLREDEPTGELDLLVKVLDSLPGSVGADLRADIAPNAPCGPTPIQFVDVFPNTPDGKVNLFPADMTPKRRPLCVSARSGDRAKYPLALICRRASARSTRILGQAAGPTPPPLPWRIRTMRARAGLATDLVCGSSTTLGDLPRPDAKLLMHPEDAAARGLLDRDLVRVFNELGEVHCELGVTASVRPRTVSLPKGLWRRSTRNGFTATALAPDTLADLGEGACFNDARVQVASLPTA